MKVQPNYSQTQPAQKTQSRVSQSVEVSFQHVPQGALLQLQRMIGNKGVQRLLTTGQISAPPLQRKPAPLPPAALKVREAIEREDYISRPTSEEDGGGAFYHLSEMSPDELMDTLGKLTVQERALLLENLPEAEGIFDTERINTALRGIGTNDPESGENAVILDDAIDQARTLDLARQITDAIQKAEEETSGGFWGFVDRNIWDVEAPYAAVYELMLSLPDAELQAALAHLSDADLVRLINHLGDAPDIQRARLGTLLASLYGKAPDHPIPTNPFSSMFATLVGLSRVDLYRRLRLLSRENRQVLLDHIDDAPEECRTLVEEVLVDLQGDETNMESDDLIDLNSVKGKLSRSMAEIYNNYGQFLEEQARSLNITTAAAAGIMKIESGGKTFDPSTDLPVVRFENHKFWTLWGSQKENRETFKKHFRYGEPAWEGHMWRRDPEGEWQEQHVQENNQEKEWEVIEFAEELSDKETAYKAMSMGAGQTMGFNHKEKAGFDSAVEMFDTFAKGERPQIESIFDFIRNTEGLADAVRAGDYATLAKLYNGAGEVKKQQEYATYISNAAAVYAQVTKGKKHVFPPSEEAAE